MFRILYAGGPWPMTDASNAWLVGAFRHGVRSPRLSPTAFLIYEAM